MMSLKCFRKVFCRRHKKYAKVLVLIISVITICLVARALRSVFFEQGAAQHSESIRQRQMEYIERLALLQNISYVMQPRDTATLVANLNADQLCFKTSMWHGYAVCPLQNDYITKSIRLGWNVEFASLLVKYLLLTPDAAYIDIGANIGTLCIPVMLSLPSDRWVIIVEPSRRNIRSILLAINRNKLRQSKWAMIDRAMWNVSDQEVGWMSWWNSSNGFLEYLNSMPGYNLSAGAPRRAEVVKTATFDDHILPLSGFLGIKRAILKIDIEGAECIAFQKAGSFLRRIRIPYIFMEYYPFFGYQANWECIRELLSLLTSHGYRAFKSELSMSTVDDMLNVNQFREWKDIHTILWKRDF